MLTVIFVIHCNTAIDAEALICLLVFFLCYDHQHHIIYILLNQCAWDIHIRTHTNATMNTKLNRGAGKHAQTHARTYAYIITYAYNILFSWAVYCYSNETLHYTGNYVHFSICIHTYTCRYLISICFTCNILQMNVVSNNKNNDKQEERDEEYQQSAHTCWSVWK